MRDGVRCLDSAAQAWPVAQQRILLTGATGALGRVVHQRLLACPTDPFVLTPGRGDRAHPLDLSQPENIASAVEHSDPQLVLHLAASLGGNLDEAYAINVAATRLLLDAVQRLNHPCRVVLIGSAAEYGSVEVDDNPIREDHVLRPRSIYGMTKAWQTELAYLYASYGVDVVVARPFNLYGPRLSSHLFLGQFLQAIEDARSDGKLCIKVGRLTELRDYLAMKDAVTQLLVVAEHGLSGMVYHLGSGVPTRMRDLLQLELQARGMESIELKEDVGYGAERAGGIPVIYADMRQTINLFQQAEIDPRTAGIGRLLSQR